MDVIQSIIDISTKYLVFGGVFFGFLLVFLECFIPLLPLSVFVALNVNAFGFFVGIVISWLATTIGSFACYLFFYYIEGKIKKRFYHDSRIKKGLQTFHNISISQLVLIITLPFTPSFFVNALSGFSKISYEKFIISVLIGKVFVIVFWGYIGKSFIESLTDIKSILYIIITLVFSYLLSDYIGKKMSIK